jgi:putative endonuclease
MHHNYYVYITASNKRVLYVGMTNDLVHRIAQHKQHLIPGFTKRYNVDQLVYFEHTHDARAAIEREKELKSWVRAKKVALVESMNPGWKDLYETIVSVGTGA